MSKTVEQLTITIKHLQEENKNLLDSVENLQQAQTCYEEIIGDNNSSLLRSDMARMELEQIFSAYTDPMWVIREDGIVIRANKAMCTMLGDENKNIIGKKCTDFFKHSLCNKETCPLTYLKQQKSTEQDIVFQELNCDKHYLLTTAPLVTIDGTPGIVAQFKNITSRKETERALAEANVSLEKMARIDGLTQIANRRNFDETLSQEWQRLSRTKQPISLLLGDIDYFKKYNDHYGHQAGDDCLKQIGKALADSVLRPADLAARYGGEEFVLLLPEVEVHGALMVGQRAIKRITDLGIPHAASENNDIVSISIGAATLIPSIDTDPCKLIELADEALYQAKEQGRNRLIHSIRQEAPVLSEA
jgi:diguanylate cyclase (GGDEF)-like protein/PAS domain S-box-containing protein